MVLGTFIAGIIVIADTGFYSSVMVLMNYLDKVALQALGLLLLLLLVLPLALLVAVVVVMTMLLQLMLSSLPCCFSCFCVVSVADVAACCLCSYYYFRHHWLLLVLLLIVLDVAEFAAAEVRCGCWLRLQCCSSFLLTVFYLCLCCCC